MSRSEQSGRSTGCETSLHEPALADLKSILDYLADHSPGGAMRVQRRIQRAVDLLPAHPRIGVQTADPAVRRLTTTPYPYLIFYEPTDTEIIIHAIQHAARHPSGTPSPHTP